MTREEAIKVLNTYDVNFYEYTAEEIADAIYMAVEALSAEAVHGEWVWSDEDASWKCGACCCVFEEIDWKPNYNFCPNCGAKMNGGEEE